MGMFVPFKPAKVRKKGTGGTIIFKDVGLKLRFVPQKSDGEMGKIRERCIL